MGVRAFPGVYTSITDGSFFTNTSSRFRAGYLGVAEKGPINVATPVQSLRDFHRKFGKSLTDTVLAGIDADHRTYLASAVQLTADLSDGITVVRVAHQYELVTGSGANQATGTKDLLVITTPNASLFNVGEYVRVTQLGKKSTVNARIASKTSTTLTLEAAIPLKDTYTTANVDRSEVKNAANEAEGFLQAPVWETDPVGGVSTPVLLVGSKSTFELTVSSNAAAVISDVPVGTVLKISQGTGYVDTLEVMVKRIIPSVAGDPARIVLEPTAKTEIGYQALSLQDSYSAAKIYKLNSTTPYRVVAHLAASNPGTWANSDGSRTGMILRVGPGSKSGSKKISVYENSSLAEEIDNLEANRTLADGSANPRFYETVINDKSSYVTITMLFDDALANSRDPWNLNAYSKLNVEGFIGGFNGEVVDDADIIGSVDPVTELPTGLKVFEDLDLNLRLACLAVPGCTSLPVAQELDRICRRINAVFIQDTPDVNIRQAIDWHNGEGLYRGQGKLDTYTCSFAWNWFQITDSFSATERFVPPSCGRLRAMAYTFDAYKPWSAAAGEFRGLLPEAKNVRYPRISEDAKQQIMTLDNANNLVPIVVNRNRIMVWGDRTALRSNSKLSGLHSVVLLNYILNLLAERGRKYEFDPIDDVLYNQIRLDFTSVFDTVKNERGIEEYSLVVDKTNNGPDNRNNKEVIVDFSVIPVDVMERMFINATVRESGAVLNSVR